MFYTTRSMKRNTISLRGYSLVEMLVVMGMTSVVMGAIIVSIQYFYRSNTNTLEQSLQIESARKGVAFAVRDLRELTYGDDGSYPILSFSTSSISFYSDVDRDASTERVRYFLEGSVFKKGVTNATGSPPVYNPSDEQVSILSEYVRNAAQNTPLFRYYNASSTEITSFATTTAISFISLTLIINVDPDRLPGEFTLRSSATLRNLKTNL